MNRGGEAHNSKRLRENASLEQNSCRSCGFLQKVVKQALSKCVLGGLYMQSPYEMFCMTCTLTPHPLGTYSDVLELSYDKGAD